MRSNSSSQRENPTFSPNSRVETTFQQKKNPSKPIVRQTYSNVRSSSEDSVSSVEADTKRHKKNQRRDVFNSLHEKIYQNNF